MNKMEKLQQLVEDAKRRTILWVVFVSCLAYVLSLTSNSVWFNIPIAALILISLRHLSFEFETHKKAQKPAIPPHLTHLLKYQRFIDDSLQSRLSSSLPWKRKFESPVIEAAVDNFTRHIVKEFVVDSWYAGLSTDKDVPEKICEFINDIMAEIGQRAKQINLITLITRDIIELVGNNLGLFRQMKDSINVFESLSSDEKEKNLKQALRKCNQLHPALHSEESEHKVLQALMCGMITVVMRPEDVQCSVVRCLVREILACAVLRPVMNLVNPGFMNQNIEKVITLLKERSQLKKVNTDSGSLSSSNHTRIQAEGRPETQISGKHVSQENRIQDGGIKQDTATQDDSRIRFSINHVNISKDKITGVSDTQRNLVKQSYLPVPEITLTADGKGMRQSQLVKHGDVNVNQVTHRGDVTRSLVSESSIIFKDSKRTSELLKPEKSETISCSQDSGYGVQPNEAIDISTKNVHDTIPGGQKYSPASSLHMKQKYPGQLMKEQQSTNVKHTRISSDGSVNTNHLDYWNTLGMQIYTGNTERDSESNWFTELGQSPMVHSSVSKLNCWVVAAHLQKSSSKTFAVYSIAVTDSDNNTWFVERRFRNFEQLHRKLRDLPHYNLQLPPKRFLSSNLDDSFVRERCIHLDKYLKDLLAIPSIAELHEVWDFLSVTSKSYAYSKSSSVMKTLAVNVDDAVDDMFRLLRRVGGPSSNSSEELSQSMVADKQKLPFSQVTFAHGNVLRLERGKFGQYSDDEYSVPTGFGEDEADLAEGSASDNEIMGTVFIPQKLRISQQGSGSFSLEESTADSEIYEEQLPPEWTAPKLTEPFLNLIDNVFQLHDRDWIRRQVFWMAKHIFQLGMGDAVDDLLVMQIQRLRQEDTLVKFIKAAENILWPGGVFITKARKNADIKIAKQNSQKGAEKQSTLFESQLEAARCAQVVYEALVDGAATPLVSFLGRQEYTKCAKDVYYFLQSSVFLKQLMYGILEMLLAATFPEITRYLLEIHQGCDVNSEDSAS